MKIAALSSKAYGAPNNNYTYQGDYNEFDEDLGWHDFALRSYDPQTGRFLQSDPYEQFASGYIGMGNDPVNMVDPSGGFAGMSIGNSILGGAVGGAILGGAIGALTSKDGDGFWNGALMGAIGGALIGLGSELNLGNVGNSLGQTLPRIAPGLLANGLSVANTISTKPNTSNVNIHPVQHKVNPSAPNYDGYRKNGQVYNFSGGTVQNYSKIKGDPEKERFAEFTDSKSKTTRFPGANITHFAVIDDYGITMPNGGIHASSAFPLAGLQHEYGHYLQAQFYGIEKYKIIMLASFLSGVVHDHDGHSNFWTEKDANAWATVFFGTDSDIGTNSKYIKEFSSYIKSLMKTPSRK